MENLEDYQKLHNLCTNFWDFIYTQNIGMRRNYDEEEQAKIINEFLDA